MLVRLGLRPVALRKSTTSALSFGDYEAQLLEFAVDFRRAPVWDSPAPGGGSAHGFQQSFSVCRRALGIATSSFLLQGLEAPVVTRPAEIGGAIIVWSNGLGPVNPPGVSGDAPGLNAPLSQTTKAVKLFIDGAEAQILDRPVLHPTLVGLYQINAIVPAGVTPGDEV